MASTDPFAMNFKRNIFESSAKMPAHNETISAAMLDKNDAGYLWNERVDMNVKHAPIPRVGEQK